MDICEQRDRAFWAGVFAAPEVAPALLGASPEEALALIDLPSVLPLASRNGGFLFIQSQFGAVYELHSAFRKEAWGREVYGAARAAFRRIFAEGAQLVHTLEQVGKGRTRAPKSFGFVRCGEPFDNDHGAFQLWILTREAWLQSRAAIEEMH